MAGCDSATSKALLTRCFFDFITCCISSYISQLLSSPRSVDKYGALYLSKGSFRNIQQLKPSLSTLSYYKWLESLTYRFGLIE